MKIRRRDATERQVADAIRGALRVAVGGHPGAAKFADYAARLWTLFNVKPRELPDGSGLGVHIGPYRGMPVGTYAVVTSCCAEAVIDVGAGVDESQVRPKIAQAASAALEAATDNHMKGEGCNARTP